MFRVYAFENYIRCFLPKQINQRLELQMKHKNIAITGGLGFIGSNLAIKLSELGASIDIYDINIHQNERVLRELEEIENIQIHNFDVITDKFEKPADFIFNLACPASPPLYQKHSLLTLDTCFLGTKAVLNYARECGATVVHASTSEVYGDPLIHPQTENYYGNVNTLGIRSCYDEGKRISETLCFEYALQFSLDVKIARIFNTYGPRMSLDDGRVITNFIKSFLRHEEISIFGKGQQTRSFCFISDLLNGLIKLAQSDVSVTQPINLGNPSEITIEELVLAFEKITKQQFRKKYYPLPQNDPMKRQPDISKARELLGWTPVVDLEAGLRKTLHYNEERNV